MYAASILFKNFYEILLSLKMTISGVVDSKRLVLKEHFHIAIARHCFFFYIQGVFFNWPPLKMSLDIPPQNASTGPP